MGTAVVAGHRTSWEELIREVGVVGAAVAAVTFFNLFYVYGSFEHPLADIAASVLNGIACTASALVGMETPKLVLTLWIVAFVLYLIVALTRRASSVKRMILFWVPFVAVNAGLGVYFYDRALLQGLPLLPWS